MMIFNFKYHAPALLAAITLLTACRGGMGDARYEKHAVTAEAKTGLATVSGTVMEFGEPVAGLEIRLVNPETKQSRSETTGADGVFTFRDVPPGRYSVERYDVAVRLGWSVLSIDAKPDTTTRVTRWAKGDGRDYLVGRVVDEAGQPIAGVKVFTNVWFEGSPNTVVTGANGKWRHPRRGDLGVGSELFRASHQQQITFTLPGFEAPPLIDPEPAEQPLVITMTPRPDVVVEVLDGAGTPVREVAFAAVEKTGQRWNPLPLDTETTTSISPDGRHRLVGLSRREFGLVVRKLNGPRGALQSTFVMVPAGTEREPINVRLEPPIILAGRALRADGTAAEGAHVRIQAVPKWLGGDVVNAAASGDYRSEALTHGPYDLKAEWGECLHFVTGKSEVLSADTSRDFTMPQPVTLTGRVIGPDGNALAGATIRASHDIHCDVLKYLPPVEVTTSKSGGFLIEGLERAFPPDLIRPHFDLTVVTSGWTHRFEYMLPENQSEELKIDLSGRAPVELRPEVDAAIGSGSFAFVTPDGDFLRGPRPDADGVGRMLLPKGRIEPYLFARHSIVIALPAFEVKGDGVNSFAPKVSESPINFRFDAPTTTPGKLKTLRFKNEMAGKQLKSMMVQSMLWGRERETTSEVPAGQLSFERQLVPGRYSATYEQADGARWRSAEFTVPLEGGSVPMVREGKAAQP